MPLHHCILCSRFSLCSSNAPSAFPLESWKRLFPFPEVLVFPFLFIPHLPSSLSILKHLKCFFYQGMYLIKIQLTQYLIIIYSYFFLVICYFLLISLCVIYFSSYHQITVAITYLCGHLVLYLYPLPKHTLHALRAWILYILLIIVFLCCSLKKGGVLIHVYMWKEIK